MKIKLKDIVSNTAILRDLLKIELCVIPAFSIASNIRNIKGPIADFDTARKVLIKKYAVEDNKNRVSPDKIEDFTKELNSLLEEEVDVDIKKISLKDLADIKISPKVFVAISWMFVEKESKVVEEKSEK